MWRALRRVFVGDSDARRSQRRRATLDGENPDWFDVRMLPFAAAHQAPPMSADSLSLASNPSATSSYNSSTRRRHHKYIAMQYFGPSSQATQFDLDEREDDASRVEASAGSSFEGQASSPRQEEDGEDDVERVVETPAQRLERKENERAFESLVHLANTKQPVTLRAFKRSNTSSLRPRDHTEDNNHSNHGEEDPSSIALDKELNTELIEAYVAYTHSIGHTPDIEVAVGEPLSDDEDEVLATERLSFVQQRGRVHDTEHWGTQWIGTRFSKRRGCVQFWAFLLVGVVVTVVMIVFLAQVRLNEVLHLDAFAGEDVALTDDFAFMHLRDEVGFRLKYEIDAGGRDIQVLLLTEDNYERFLEGDNFTVVTLGSRLRTPHASLPLTRIDNDNHEEMYLVVQPCQLLRGDTTVDVCGDSNSSDIRQLPSSVSSSEKLFALRKAQVLQANAAKPATLTLRSFYVNPMPDTCSASGWQGAPFVLLFVPYLLASLFGLRVFQMLAHCESFRANLERNYKHEFAVPESEVDYWQPSPWDRKVPKTRLLGPCCWVKMRRPLEPFYTWWRHENYFTWIFFPYRNERLSRGERAIIIFCSLYITFYVTFLLAMLHNAFGDNLPTVLALVIYWLLLVVLPSLGKAIFKEIFKLIFRQRRKYFRLKASGGDTSGFSFRFAFLMQVLVVVFITLAQGPMIYIWLYRSCKFLGEFMYFGALAALARLSLFGLLMDFCWYSVITVCGWRDLCPHCTERLSACDCFNDELLVLAVERVGAKWPLILLLDDVLSRHAGHEPQFKQYSAEQLQERWLTIVGRAESHLEKLEKLHAYRLKKKRDALRRRHKSRLSLLVERASFRARPGAGGPPGQETDAIEDEENETTDLLADVDSARERKIVALDRKIRAGAFHKQRDEQASIADVFRSMEHAVRGQTSSSNVRDEARVESSTQVMFTTPAQRQARREDERERRERAFSVLSGYRIEKMRPVEPEVASKPASHFGKWWRGIGGSALGDARELLVPPTAPGEANEHGDVVVVVREDPALAPVEEEAPGAGGDGQSHSTTDGTEEHPPVKSRRQSRSCVQTDTYEVSAVEPTLWDATVGRAGALVSWVFKYDSSQY